MVYSPDAILGTVLDCSPLGRSDVVHARARFAERSLRDLRTTIASLVIRVCGKAHEFAGMAFQDCLERPDNLACGHPTRGGAADAILVGIDVIAAAGKGERAAALRQTVFDVCQRLALIDLFAAVGYTGSPTERRDLLELDLVEEADRPVMLPLIEASGRDATMKKVCDCECVYGGQLASIRDEVVSLLDAVIRAEPGAASAPSIAF